MLHDPFEALLNLQRGLDSYRDSAWLEASPSGAGPFPPLNVFRKGDDVVVIIEVPGVSKSDLALEVKGNTLRISGAKKVEYESKASLHRRERAEGRFDRTVTLPIAIEAGKVVAEYRDGILALHLPRAESEKPRSISIN